VLQLDEELRDITALYSALERLEGPGVLTRYEKLIADQEVPGAPFVFYQRQRALGAFTEARAHAAIGVADLAAVVVEATRT
jgi:hypothetical protein